MNIEGAGINIGSFFLYVEVGNRSIFLVSISTLRNVILLMILISCVKLRTELFWKVSCIGLISSVLSIREEYVVSVPYINSRFIDGIKKTLFPRPDVKITENRFQIWPHRNSILLDEYISVGIVKCYHSSAG